MIKNVFIFTFLQIYVRGKKNDLRKGECIITYQFLSDIHEGARVEVLNHLLEVLSHRYL